MIQSVTTMVNQIFGSCEYCFAKTTQLQSNIELVVNIHIKTYHKHI